jgi:hypothetical protein
VKNDLCAAIESYFGISENKMNFYSNGVQLGSEARLLKE